VIVSWVVVLSLAGSLVCAGWLFTRGRTRNVLACVVAVFIPFAYGPLVNLITGAAAFDGIVLDELDPAALGFFLAVAALTVADVLTPQRPTFTSPPMTRIYELLPVVLVVLAGFAAIRIATVGPAMLEVDKIARLEMAGSWHYPFLLFESYALAMYFVAARTGFYRSVYWINAACYLAYCLVTAERDFLFVGLAVLIHVQLFNPSVRSRWLVALGAGGAALAALLAALREGLEFSVSQALNQGSLPFVDTFMRDVVPAFYPYRAGSTYVEAVASLLPGVERHPLEGWLVSLYTPGAPVGYGFSLTAEAYVNFGPLGVPAVFLALGLSLRWIVNRSDRSDFWTYLSVVSVTAMFNALRGESGQLLRIVLYGAAFYAVLWLMSSRHVAAVTAPHGTGGGHPGPAGGPRKRPRKLTGLPRRGQASRLA
jgi:hypothetical protein